MRSVTLLFAALVVAVVLAGLVGVASAGRLSFSSQTFRMTFPNVEYSGAFGTVRCALTLQGSLHSRSVTKTAGSLIGYITTAEHAAACAQGGATVSRGTLPWHVRYGSFAGTLPTITSVGMNVLEYSASLREPALGTLCSIRSTAAEPVTLALAREAGGGLTSARIGGTVPSSCGFNITLAGTSNTLTVLNAVTAISVTLI